MAAQGEPVAARTTEDPEVGPEMIEDEMRDGNAGTFALVSLDMMAEERIEEVVASLAAGTRPENVTADRGPGTEMAVGTG